MTQKEMIVTLVKNNTRALEERFYVPTHPLSNKAEKIMRLMRESDLDGSAFAPFLISILEPQIGYVDLDFLREPIIFDRALCAVTCTGNDNGHCYPDDGYSIIITLDGYRGQGGAPGIYRLGNTFAQGNNLTGTKRLIQPVSNDRIDEFFADLSQEEFDKFISNAEITLEDDCVHMKNSQTFVLPWAA